MEIFQFPATGTDIRTVQVDGEPWFVAADACELLGFRDASNAVRSLQADEKGYSNVSTPSGEQRMLVVNESGIYALIFRSKNGKAQAFRKWVTSDLLPTLRRTGRYETQSPIVMSVAPPALSLEQRSVILHNLVGVCHPDYLNSEGQILYAEATGRLPEIEPDRRLLYAETYLIERGMSRSDAARKSSQFGLKLAAKYRALHGAEPIKGDRNIGGRITQVNTYSEVDRPLFDAVWLEHYAPKLAVAR
jgi:prophage antirepressor-like protein